MMPLGPQMTPQVTNHDPEDQVFWMKLTSPTSFLQLEWETWRPLIMNHYDKSKEPFLPLHCTMFYDKGQKQEDYEESWDEEINNKTTVIQYADIMVGPQGAAAVVKFPEKDIAEWFQVADSAPHVTLLIADKYESHDLGPMIQEAKKVTEWIDTAWNRISVSKDGLFFKISFSQADEAIAEHIKVPGKRQMAVTEEHASLLEQVPEQVKAAHNRDETRIPVDVRDVQVGDKVFIRVFKRQWNEPRREGPFKVVLTTPTALKVEGKPFWFHKNHCTRHRPPDPPGLDPGPTGSAHAERAAASLPPHNTIAHSQASDVVPGASADASSTPSSSDGQRRSARLAARRSPLSGDSENDSVHSFVSDSPSDSGSSNADSPATQSPGRPVSDSPSPEALEEPFFPHSSDSAGTVSPSSPAPSLPPPSLSTSSDSTSGSASGSCPPTPSPSGRLSYASSSETD
ncbi:actin cytoskeleton-regulatory complex protein PAN1-like [Fundulus heteroclitus]|uniref:actin cytoskeleton-regulatory complex protein PAN1-like n=1 Tax=Fundulus heteroclitus TaxID=8078 RepID=UPI00165B43FF|nr:actin cytoskeleton-regulatory complex protein PAN1-like [Fundulus heteroclitus]